MKKYFILFFTILLSAQSYCEDSYVYEYSKFLNEMHSVIGATEGSSGISNKKILELFSFIGLFENDMLKSRQGSNLKLPKGVVMKTIITTDGRNDKKYNVIRFVFLKESSNHDAMFNFTVDFYYSSEKRRSFIKHTTGSLIILYMPKT
jgi:hypothetical protein